VKALKIVIVSFLFLGCVNQYQGPAGDCKEEVLQTFEDTIGQRILSVEFTTSSGSLKVHVWDEPQYKIEVTKWAMGNTPDEARTKAENVEVSVSVDNEGEVAIISLEVRALRYTGAHVEAFLPRLSFSGINLSTTNGFIELEDMSAESISLEVENGFIEVQNIDADVVTLRVVNGYIKGVIKGSRIDMETGSGFIDMQIGE
jgi:DUF4097 and DUF4098 domain-containing protein YvlB